MIAIDHNKLFWFDAAGATLTAIMHGFVLTRFSELIGVQTQILIYLSIAALLFAIYSASCAIFKPSNWRLFLRVIASANICFCIATLVILFMNRSEVTKIGLAYFLLEILIIIAIAIIEFRKANTN